LLLNLDRYITPLFITPLEIPRRIYRHIAEICVIWEISVDKLLSIRYNRSQQKVVSAQMRTCVPPTL